MRKTKVVCTMGPREEDEKILNALCKEMDVARFNFSHGSHESHKAMFKRVQKAAKEAGRPIATLLDTKGPEIRTGDLAPIKVDGREEVSKGGEGKNLRPEPVYLKKGSTVVVTTRSCLCDSETISVSYKGLPRDVEPGDKILLDDGLIALKVREVGKTDVVCRVQNGGLLGARKGVNLPDSVTSLPRLTAQDVKDIEFGLKLGFDYIAASFVRDAQTIKRIKSMIKDAGAHTKVIAKIESSEGIDNFDEILEAADGIMVARGDLGVEMDAKMIPEIQRDIIYQCNAAGKPVITATQMLDSMMRNPRPTRAEVTDVANAVYEGSDAIMLSGETASGDYPVEALRTMCEIAEYTEDFADARDFVDELTDAEAYDEIANATCYAAAWTAEELCVDAIIAPTISGQTALLLSKYRPDAEIYALSPHESVVRQMMLYWGVHPIQAARESSTDALIESTISTLQETKLVKKGDLCVLTAGVVTGKHSADRSETNAMRVIRI